jgi:hypothetical protein
MECNHSESLSANCDTDLREERSTTSDKSDSKSGKKKEDATESSSCGRGCVLSPTESGDDQEVDGCDVSIERENMRGVTWVTIEEMKSGEWGIGGNALQRKPSRHSRRANLLLEYAYYNLAAILTARLLSMMHCAANCHRCRSDLLTKAVHHF